MLSLDTETELFGPGRLAPPLVCVSLARPDQEAELHAHVTVTPDQVREWYADELLLGLNLAYDSAVLGAEYPEALPAIFAAYRSSRVRDVGLDARLVDNAKGGIREKGYSVAGLAKRYLGLDIDKDDSPRLTFGALRGLPLSAYSQAQKDYALGDAGVPLWVYECLLREQEEWAAVNGPENPLLVVGPFRAYVDFALRLASCWGVRSNLGRCLALEKELERDIDEAGQTLREAGILRSTGTRNMKAAQEAMIRACQERGLDRDITKTGKELLKEGRYTRESLPLKFTSLDKDACAKTNDPVMLAYTLYTTSDSLRNKIRDLRAGAYVPLQAEFDSLKETGRTSCRKPKYPVYGAQLQNPPRAQGTRECLEPREGFIFVGADYSAAEMHTLAESLHGIFGGSRLEDLLVAGKCPYVDFASALHGMSYEEIDNHPERGKYRTPAKPVVLGVPGGMGAATMVGSALGYGVVLTKDQAAEHIRIMKRNSPEVDKFLQMISEYVRKGGDTVCLPNGLWRGGLNYSAMANSYFQSPAAFAGLAAFCEVQRLAYTVPESPLFGFRVWAWVHDEILGEAPVAKAPEMADELARVMEVEFNRFVPCAPTKAEPAIFWRWSKAKRPDKTEYNAPVRDSNGRLVPSDPENQPDWYSRSLAQSA